MAVHEFRLYAPDNFSNLPNEQTSFPFAADIALGATITYLGGGESETIAINDGGIEPLVFDESLTDQVLDQDVTFGGTTYSAGQVCTPAYWLTFDGSDGETYSFYAFLFSGNTNAVPDGAVFMGPVPPPGTVLTVTLNANATNANPPPSQAPPYAGMFLCFGGDTAIRTPAGDRPADALRPGDMVWVADGPPVPVRWVRSWAEELGHVPRCRRPIRIDTGALGPGQPSQPLLVSPNHRLLIRSRAVARMFGAWEVLIEARFLTSLPGIDIADDVDRITYVHILLDRHAVLTANGALAESLLVGPQARRVLGPQMLAGIHAVLPELATRAQDPCRRIANRREAEALVARLLRNGQPGRGSGRPQRAGATHLRA